MSTVEENNSMRVEIQKLLKRINNDMNKLKSELSALNNLFEGNASLPITAKMANEKLIIAAKEAGIDLENIDSIQNMDESEDNEAQESADTEQYDGTPPSISNISTTVAAVERLSESMKHTFK